MKINTAQQPQRQPRDVPTEPRHGGPLDDDAETEDASAPPVCDGEHSGGCNEQRESSASTGRESTQRLSHR
jgi:hypothetical protein